MSKTDFIQKEHPMMTRSMFTRFTAGFLLMAVPFVSGAVPRHTQRWIEVLQSDSSVFEKARACQRLGEYGTREAVPALASLLNHNRLSAYARAGLERIPGPEAAAALRKALSQTQGALRVGVIHSLAALRDEKAVPALTSLTRGADGEAAKAALLALGRIAGDEAIALLEQALNVGPEALRPDAAAACLLAAEAQLNRGQAEGAKALYDTVRQAEVPASYRIGATRGAIMARQANRIAFLVRQLHCEESAIRDVAFLTIREIPSDALATALNAELDGAPGDLQVKLILALRDCHNAQSFPAIRAKVESDDTEIRLAALRVLKDIGGADSAPTFIDVLRNHRNAEELSLAVSSLEHMEGAEADELILKALSLSAEPDVRTQLIRLLGKRKVTAAADELLQQAVDPDTNVRIAAYQALKSLAGFDELPALIALTKKCRDDSVRDAAVSAVHGACRNSGHLDRAGALVLRELETSTVTSERESWIRVLTLLGYSPALPAITGTLEDSDRELVQSTITQLGRWPDPTPIEALSKVVEGDSRSELRGRALAAVLQLATGAADRKQATDEELVAWFRRAGRAVQSAHEKRLLISGLGRVQHIESVRLLASYVDDPDVKIETVYAIVSAAGPLVKGRDYQAVEAVLKRISGIEDQRLLNQIADLERDIQSTAARLSRSPVNVK